MTQSQARQLLPTLIGMLSLDLYDRGWIDHLPFTLWAAVNGEPGEPLRDDLVALYRHVSAVAGGWAHYDMKAGPRFVLRAVWAREYSAWQAVQPPIDPELLKRWDQAQTRMRRHTAKQRRMTPDELCALATVAVETTDPDTVADLKAEFVRGFYGKPVREVPVRGGFTRRNVESPERLAAIEAGMRLVGTTGLPVTFGAEWEVSVGHGTSARMTVTVPTGKLAWFEQRLAKFDRIKPIAFQGADDDRWIFVFNVPDQKSAQALAASLKRGGVHQFKRFSQL